MKQSILLRIIIILAIYFGLRYYGGPTGRQILYPVILLVTFLHEFGHALGALLTGGAVEDILVNKDGSGLTRTYGGSRSIILMGGYLGSAIFGNILFLIGARFAKLVNPILLMLAVSMIFTGIYWYTSSFTSLFLIGFALLLILLVWKTNFGREVLMFLGLATILYIIQDINIGPTSDLTKYAETMKFLPISFWKYSWLTIAILLFLLNLKIIFSQTKKELEEDDDFLYIKT